MSFHAKSLLTLSLLILVSCQNSPTRNIASERHISNNTQQLVNWETRANAISKRSNELIRVEHYEIPLRLLEQDFDESLDQATKDSIIFSKNGEKYVRWLINPEDTKWHLEVVEFLKKNNVDHTAKKFFDGYLTASRSMILVNPASGATFSLKVSTNLTGGKWSDKKQTWKDARQVRRMNKYVKGTIPKMQTASLVIMDEPLAMGIKELDQAMIMRSLNDLPDDNHYYIPAFSIMHETEGVRIAKLNGASDPVKYWDQHLVQPLANAMAEYFSITGAWYDSPHAQNFLVELDNEMKPTGRIVLRDLGDSYLLEDFVKNTNFAWIMKDWEAGKVVAGQINTGVGFLHGNEGDSWLRGLEYKEYGWNFYKAFEKRFSEISGIPMAELSKVDSKDVLYSYSRKIYPTKSEAWQKFAHYANCMNGEAKTLSGEKCPDVLLKKQIKIDCLKAATAIIKHQ